MVVSDCWVLRNMDVRHSIFKLLLFQILVAWCSAKHVTIENNLPRVEILSNDVENDVQDSIRNLLHNGLYSHQHLNPSSLQVTTPVKVTYEGEFVSHSLDHEHPHGHARARRDTHERGLPHDLHYNLTVDGRDLRLDLRPSVSFVGPAMIIERHRISGRTRERPKPKATACHYTGAIRGQPASSIALSACDGLAGLLRTEHGEYWIEPSNQISSDSSQGRPHVIYKRSALMQQGTHRGKREVDTRTHSDRPTQRFSSNKYTQNQPNKYYDTARRDRLAMDRRRREYLEERRRRLEAMRRNPTEYRSHQAKLRMEQRRLQAMSKSISVESKSVEQNSALKNGNRKKINNDMRLRRVKNRRNRRRRSKNCATKQPPYQWKTKDMDHHELEQHKNKGQNRNNHYNSNYRRGNPRRQRRPTRSVSKPRHVEVLLVADKSMTDFHDEDNIETYLLTIMNMVSSLYMDPSIGNYIKVVVVKIIFVEDLGAAPDLEVTSDADTTLTSFCRWQQQLNPDDDANPHHHDVAILITRQDICSQHGNPCSTLGVAHVAGMCKPDRSCSVNEDNGIMLAHTITHELGHNFGLYHDTEKIGCHRREGSTLHIMTPIFEADTVQVAWSRCSKRDVTNFLDAGMGECLSDRPSQDEYIYPEVPAGVMFDAATQCHLQFGAEAVVCAKPSELCEHLWCLVNNTCKTMLRPAAPGTTCGPDMWCQNQTCVARTPSPAPRHGGWGPWSEWSECSRTCGAGVSTQSRKCNNPEPSNKGNYCIGDRSRCVARTPSPAPRHGGWGPWSEWSECSRTCGAGVSTQSRKCNNPEPSNKGNYCIGDRSRYKICNTDPCPINEPTFREVQCAKYNNRTYKNVTVAEWIPYFDQDRPCELKCVPRDDSDLQLMSPAFVADGTPCRQSIGSRDMCIAGVCYKVGCDWEVNSDAEEDACGVCGGNGSACKTVKGIYSKGTTKQSGFSEVAVIPAGSRNVKIQEKVSPGNYISIGSAKSRKIYLSGARNTTLTEYFVAGAQAIYERDRDWEKVRISGPIEEDIKVYQRIYRGRHRNPGVTYQYTVDRQRQRRFGYRLSDWSPCSVTCGVGYMRRHYECVDEHNREYKASHTNIPRPPPQPGRDVPVHGGPAAAAALRVPPVRLVALLRDVRRGLHASSLRVRRRTYRGRHRNPGVTYQYTVDRQRQRRFGYRLSDWSPCSVTCGVGYMRRHYECVDEHNHLVEQSQCYHIEPPRHEALMQQCRPTACPHWWVGAWNHCSKPCHMPGEEATKQRSVYCVDKVSNGVVEDSKCDAATKPISIIKCADVPAC
ncbi:A disintegrin and metalloproteinase with thrombospondin motifs 7 [Ostrinia nubilalis]|uniref:A disintegrin and metalloproteinase with thrombospondin motifs 7 n=1 Tax=Ostrinia nubilalis TaxID=29057 RepID=UPI0030824BBF